jgi:low affinity Fe/Cu permease
MRNEKPWSLTAFFGVVAQVTSQKLGHAVSFVAAFLLIVVWAAMGPVFKYSDTWQLVINTGTTIVTFLMVFLIQNTQNRDMAALHLKLDELIRVSAGARDALLTLEDMTEEELRRLKANFAAIASRSEGGGELAVIKDLEEAAEKIDAAEENIRAAAAAAKKE